MDLLLQNHSCPASATYVVMIVGIRCKGGQQCRYKRRRHRSKASVIFAAPDLENVDVTNYLSLAGSVE